jgi:hypothetical protein
MQNLIGADELVGAEELVGDGALISGYGSHGHVMYGADPDAAALLAAGGDVMYGDALVSGAINPHLGGHYGALLHNLAAKNAQAQRFKQASHHLAMQRGQPMVIRQMQPDRKLKLPAGFFALAVAAGASAFLTVRPQCLFRADELIIPELYSQNFIINEMSIGQTRLIVGGQPVPALVFSEKSYRPIKLDWPTNQITQEILLTMTNVAAVAKDLYGCFYGRAAF